MSPSIGKFREQKLNLWSCKVSLADLRIMGAFSLNLFLLVSYDSLIVSDFLLLKHTLKQLIG